MFLQSCIIDLTGYIQKTCSVISNQTLLIQTTCDLIWAYYKQWLYNIISMPKQTPELQVHSYTPINSEHHISSSTRQISWQEYVFWFFLSWCHFSLLIPQLLTVCDTLFCIYHDEQAGWMAHDTIDSGVIFGFGKALSTTAIHIL